ncbi:histidine phosphatase family protein [Pseudoluteimonas lycopersici]|nr:histidine phosphatase family protein [Lysobacter lycopersici]
MSRILIPLCLALSLGAFAPAHAADEPVHTIVLVRHGNYAPDPSVDENIGPHLSPIGVAQAHLAANALATLPPFDGLYASPMQRARDTAAVIGKDDFPDRKFEVVDDLAECTPPTPLGDVMKTEKPADMAACKAKLDRVYARFFTAATDHDRSDLLVCHGNVIRYLVTRALGVDTTAWLAMSIGNASITTIRIDAKGRAHVIAVGDVGHIPPKLRTSAWGDPPRDLAIPELP